MLDRRRLFLQLTAASLVAAPEAWAADKRADSKGGGSPFLELPTLTATAIRATGGRGVLTVQATLRIPDDAKRLRAQQMMPRLKDAYVASLQVWAYQMIPGSLPNVALMTRALQKATNRVLGPDGGATVLLGGVMLV